MIQLYSGAQIILVTLSAFIVPATVVLACEGQCIVGITNALLGNYTTPMSTVFSQMDNAIDSQIIGSTASGSTHTKSFLGPLRDEYSRRGYDNMENAIFKSYFHGKCQDPTTGIDPTGCPNPDCPVVCGTPGSIVHFYSKFRSLAFEATVHLFDEIAKPSSAAYHKFEEGVISATSSSSSVGNKQRIVRFMRKTAWLAESRVDFGKSKRIEKRADSKDIRNQLQTILQKFQSELETTCGGKGESDSNEFPSCSWEAEFKKYILSFP